MDSITAKQVVRDLMNTWTLRAGLQKQALAAQAGFLTYDDFYRAYLDVSRPIGDDPDAALNVVQALTAGLPLGARCTADEAVTFFIHTRLPLDRYPDVVQRGMFSPAEWRAALQQHLAIELPTVAPAPDPVTLLAAIDELVRRRTPPPDDPAIQLPVDAVLPPTALPLPYRMPLAPARLFGGRDLELQTLVQLVADQAIGAAAAITGIGGVGKTSLAAEFAHRYGTFFRGGVFWVSCAEPAAIELELAACGAAGLVPRDDWRDLALGERVELVLQAWQMPTPRLLIFDNCEDDETFLRWRPSSGGCRVLLTSRRTRWSRSLGISELRLGELAPDASLALLRRYRPDLTADVHLAAIAAELGGLPLALHLAGSYLESYQDDRVLGDPARFLRDLQAHGPLDHAAMQGVDVAPSATRHMLHVERTFAMSIDQLDPRLPTDAPARALLGVMSWLAPGEPFDVELLAAAADIPVAVARSAVQRLRDLGLLRIDAGLLRVHRLVAACAQTLPNTLERRAGLEQALIMRAEQAYAAQNVADVPLVLPHMERLKATAGGAAPALLNSMPFLFELAGDLHSSRAYAQEAYAALAQQDSLETPLGAEVIANLAEWERLLGNPHAARPLYEQALAIRLRILPPGDLALAESRNNLGELLREQNELDAARSQYEQALAIALQSGGPEHNTTLAVRNNLAVLLNRMQLHADAAAQLTPLLAAATAVFGAHDPRVATARVNLGMALAALGQADAAREQHIQALADLTAALGERHPLTLMARLNAVRPLILLGEVTAARTELHLLEPLLSSVYSPDHPLTERAQAMLAELAP